MLNNLFKESKLDFEICTNRNEWNKFLEKTNFARADYTYESLHYHLAASKKENNLKLQLIKLIKNKNTVGIFPLFSEKNNKLFGKKNIVSPLFFKNISVSLEDKINKELKLILISYAKLSGLENIILSEKSINNEPSSWIKSFMDEKATFEIFFDLYINLQLPIEKIKNNLRKSYKSLVSSKDLHIRVMDHSNLNIEIWNNFKNLHFKLSKRKTRNEDTWDIQYNNIKNNKSFLIYSKFRNKLTGANYVGYSKDEANYGSSAILKNFNNKLGHTLQFETIKHCKKMGHMWYNLGLHYFNNNDSELRNISDFKKGFATNILPRYKLKLNLNNE